MAIKRGIKRWNPIPDMGCLTWTASVTTAYGRSPAMSLLKQMGTATSADNQNYKLQIGAALLFCHQASRFQK